MKAESVSGIWSQIQHIGCIFFVDDPDFLGLLDECEMLTFFP